MKQIINLILIFVLSLTLVNAVSSNNDLCSFGDANGDCVISLADINMFDNYLNGQEYNFYYGTPLTLDVDGDGELTIEDRIQMENNLNGQEYTFNGPTDILVSVTNPDFNINDLNNLKVEDIYNLEITVVGSGIPKPFIGVQFSSTNIELSTYYATTDSNGKIDLTATMSEEGDGTFTAHIDGDPTKNIEPVDYTISRIIHPLPQVEPTPTNSEDESPGGGSDHDYANQGAIIPVKRPITPTVNPVENTQENTNQNTPVTEAQVEPTPTGAAILNTIESNPIIAGIFALIIIGLITSAVLYFR